MSAVVYSLASRRNGALVATLRELLQQAEIGELTDLGAEARDRHGRPFLVRHGVYEDDGRLSDLGFRLQIAAAFKNAG